MAAIWNVTERTVSAFCKEGKIPGAVKNGKSWQILDDAENLLMIAFQQGGIEREIPELIRSRFQLESPIMCGRRQNIIMWIRRC